MTCPRCSVEENSIDECILNFQEENENYLLDVPSPYMAYYLKEDMFYSFFRKKMKITSWMCHLLIWHII